MSKVQPSVKMKQSKKTDGSKFNKGLSTEKRLKVIAFSRDMYLELDELGNKKYSDTEIAKAVSKRFHLNFTNKTIGDWAKQEGWAILLQTAKNIGVEKALKDKHDAEESIKAAKSNEIADIYQAESNKYTASTDLIIKALNRLKFSDPEKLEQMLPTLVNISNASFNNLQKLNGGGNGDKYDDIFEAFKNI